MATLLENLDLEVAHFNNFKAHIPGFDNLCQRTVTHLLEMGLIQVSTAGEHAVAACSGSTVTSTFAADISDGSDVKLSTVRTSGYGKRYSSQVCNVAGKTGFLRVQVFERKQNKFYYFVIPHSAYKHIPKTSNIEISFLLDGSPRRVPARTVQENWWNYEVDSFIDMAVGKHRLAINPISTKAMARHIKTSTPA